MAKKINYSVMKDPRNPGKWVVTRNGKPMDTHDNLDAVTASTKSKQLQREEDAKDKK